MRDTIQPPASAKRPAEHASSGFSLLEMMLVLAVMGIVAAMAVPMINSLGYLRTAGDARNLSHAVSLARMMAASQATRTRVFVDLTDNAYHTDVWQRTGAPGWVREGGRTRLSDFTAGFGFGIVSTPPPNTQAAIALAPLCLDDTGNPIGNSACIMFNSRGIPIDSTGAPTAAYALYITDDTAVFGVTVSATSAIRLWRTPQVSVARWVQQ